ncbi:hypothetical protein ACH5RR_012868 [Cinchona calisaya]|uniref:FAR1 domain-containing protein n=1 Tax=Cinchona calisaya TaxID=153742 RepID=A0ABD3ACI8_9GENT
MGSTQQEDEKRQTIENLEYEFDIECRMKQDQFKGDMQASIFENSTNAHIKDGKVAEMEFQSINDAFKSYSNYARNRGFSIQKQCAIRSKKDKLAIEFVCSKQGFSSRKYSQGVMPRIRQENDVEY